MLLVEQLELRFAQPHGRPTGRDARLEATSAMLLRQAGAPKIADAVQVRWSGRLRSAAGRAHFRTLLITLNPRLQEHGEEEIDRTLRHELAHLLAQLRAGRRRIAPHGTEWRVACHDLGIAGETRCHTLPFPVTRRESRYLYRCSHCGRNYPRVRRPRRAIACLACCRKLNRGRYDERARLRLMKPARN